jgi:hypothetical protein
MISLWPFLSTVAVQAHNFLKNVNTLLHCHNQRIVTFCCYIRCNN